MLYLGMKRREQILSRLRAECREWRIDELASAVGTTAITIRRDLDKLAGEGLVVRTHGGCLYAGRMAIDAAYHRRVAENFELKRAIGRAAAREIRPGDSILVDDGSTCFHVAASLADCGSVTLYTNSLPVIAEVAGFPGVTLYLLGGKYDHRIQHIGGGFTEKMLDDLSFDTVFLGTDAVDSDGRCLVLSQDTARTAQCMLRRGRRRILLADHTKANAAGKAAFGRLGDFDMWITTPGMGPAAVRRFGKMTTVRMADMEKT